MIKNQKKTVKRLKNQLIVLRRKEKASRMKLRVALKKVNHLIRSNQKKLNKKTKEAKAKVASYEKIIKSIKKKMKVKPKKS